MKTPSEVAWASKNTLKRLCMNIYTGIFFTTKERGTPKKVKDIREVDGQGFSESVGNFMEL
jgi:hypothetical protein